MLFVLLAVRRTLFRLESSLKAVEEYLRDPDFNPEAVRRVSFAAAGLCAWAINIVQYYRVYCEVEPKRLAAEEATEQLRQTEEQFRATQTKLAVGERHTPAVHFFGMPMPLSLSRNCKLLYKVSKTNIKRLRTRRMNVNERPIRPRTRSI